MSILRRLSEAWNLIELWNWLQVTLPFSASGGVIIIAAFFDHLPLTYVIVAASLVFAATTGGLLWHHNRTFQRNPEYKLKFIRPHVGREISGGKSLIGISSELRNDAFFPIQVSIERFRTSCSGRIPLISGQLDKKEVVVQPGEIRWLHDAVIDITGINDPHMIGSLELSIVYGRSGRLRYKISQDLDIFIPLDPTKEFRWADRIRELPSRENSNDRH